MMQKTSRSDQAFARVVILAVAGGLLLVASSCEQKSHPLTAVRDRPLNEVTPPSEVAPLAGSGSREDAPSPQNVADDAGPTPELAEEVRTNLVGSTVRVITDEGDASGVTLGKDAEGHLYVLTVQHASETNIRAVDLFSMNSLKYPKSHQRIAPVEIMAVSERRDLAVLRSVKSISGSIEVTPIRRKLAKTPKHAYSCGYSVAKGTIPLPEKIIDTLHGVRPGQVESSTMWKTKAPQELGRSGGPLVDLDGSLIGLASGKDKRNGYYCHHSEIVDQLDELDLGWLLK